MATHYDDELSFNSQDDPDTSAYPSMKINAREYDRESKEQSLEVEDPYRHDQVQPQPVDYSSHGSPITGLPMGYHDYGGLVALPPIEYHSPGSLIVSPLVDHYHDYGVLPWDIIFLTVTSPHHPWAMTTHTKEPTYPMMATMFFLPVKHTLWNSMDLTIANEEELWKNPYDRFSHCTCLEQQCRCGIEEDMSLTQFPNRAGRANRARRSDTRSRAAATENNAALTAMNRLEVAGPDANSWSTDPYLYQVETTDAFWKPGCIFALLCQATPVDRYEIEGSYAALHFVVTAIHSDSMITCHPITTYARQLSSAKEVDPKNLDTRVSRVREVGILERRSAGALMGYLEGAEERESIPVLDVAK
ncbi:hypothetical protein QBC40DRAFT_350328 [Triangularia verruculosa]|uniref:Uncharacterized protein n=1 Tax=Triangularia verruculosa TaxID=2587418 RepID=A0AAN6XF88_9PEZI|nr:hypothetical protein QBC40DRAFT_350328 [Triangularia verruculosa]